MTVPSERVASTLTPRSTPTTGPVLTENGLEPAASRRASALAVRRSGREQDVLVTYRCRGARWEYARMSEQTTWRKTFQERLRPTPAQERERERVLWHCRTLDNVALEQRIFLWRQRGVSITRS